VSELDPEIAAFVAQLSADWRSHPPLSTLSLPEARQVAEQVRSRWRVGGPEMERIEESLFAIAAGPMRVRCYKPFGAMRAAAMIYLHGGGFTMFSIDTHDRLMREYAAAAGISVIGLDYALSPEHKFPVALEQVLAFVDDHLARHDGGYLALGGDSAGANLALAAAVKMRDAGRGDTVRALLLNYGAFGPGTSDAAEQNFGGPNAVLNRAEMEYFWANYLTHPADARNPAANLLDAELHGLPPALLVVPECDILSEQSYVVVRKMGAVAELRLYPGATHSFLEAMRVSTLACDAIANSSQWLRAQLSR
jgi:acetyl esterase